MIAHGLSQSPLEDGASRPFRPLPFLFFGLANPNYTSAQLLSLWRDNGEVACDTLRNNGAEDGYVAPSRTRFSPLKKKEDPDGPHAFDGNLTARTFAPIAAPHLLRTRSPRSTWFPHPADGQVGCVVGESRGVHVWRTVPTHRPFGVMCFRRICTVGASAGLRCCRISRGGTAHLADGNDCDCRSREDLLALAHGLL